MLDHYLLIVCICIVVASVLYLFFWNRIIAYLIASVIRLSWWNQETESLWVEIGAIHFSLISGRILLKDVRYHTSNQTIKILKTQIQWRYWIRHPASEEEVQPTREAKDRGGARVWSCRVQLSFQGMEWFLYNRTAAYDNIISQMEKSTPVSQPTSSRNLLSRLARQTSSLPTYPPSTARSALKVPKFIQRITSWFKRQLPNLDPKELLPLGIHIQTGVIVLGNPSTPNLLVAEFQSAFGTFGISQSRSHLDQYKQVLGLKFQNALVQLVPNDDYVDPMSTIGSLIHTRMKQHGNANKPVLYQRHRMFLRLWKQLHLYSSVMDYFTDRRAQRLASNPLHLKRKLGKAVAVDEETPLGIDFSTHEYAIERKVLEAPALDLTYYVDVVGDVPVSAVPRFPSSDIHDIGNGDTPPEWGIDLIIFGGFLNYGPWTDRQRAELQRLFFPATYQNLEVHESLQPGDKRVWAALQILVELRDRTTLHIPFREASKDWQWDGLAGNLPGRPKKREAASIDVVVGDLSTIRYTMPMIVGPSGYESTLEAHLDEISVTSSLNDIKLVHSQSIRVRGELPAPLAWDGERTWTFSTTLRTPLLYLLRDHVNMLTDLGKDWVSGPPTDYQRFIPMIYQVKLDLEEYKLHLYLNDQNVIDKPLTTDENTLLILEGHRMGSTVTIPSNRFRPESTIVPFVVNIPDVLAHFSLPRWNSHATHAPKDGITFFKSQKLVLDGHYHYFSEVHEGNLDKLYLGISVHESVTKLFGWTIRHFITIKDNYFGSFTHFQTLNEYLEKRDKAHVVDDPLLLKYRPGKANSMQIEVSVEASGVTALQPISLTGSGRTGSLPPQSRLDPDCAHDCIALSTQDLQVHVRMHDHFLELSVNVDVITGTLRTPPGPTNDTLSVRRSQVLSIDGLDILANRLFGPPPRNSTYICIWEIQVGRVNVSTTPDELQTLAAVSSSFGINFTDAVNSPASRFVPEVDPDVTFYKVTVRSVDFLCKVDKAALLVQLSEGLKVDTNDLGTTYYKKVVCLRVPKISVKLLTKSSPDRNSWLEAAEVVGDGYVDLYSAPKDLQYHNDAQAAFIQEQDKLTNRARLIFDRFQRHQDDDKAKDAGLVHHIHGLYLPHPTLPSGHARRSSRPKSVPQSSKRSAHVRPASWRYSTRNHLSESEDDGMSELDRDAQLAKTRASTPVVLHREDNGTSTGDESDDADLTDGNSTDDEWSDLADSDDQPTSTLFSFYSPLARHYQLSDSAGFTLTRDGTLVRLPPSRSSRPTPRKAAARPPPTTSLPVDQSTTTLRLRSRNGLRVVATPLVAVVVASFQQHIETMTRPPEHILDSLLADTIGRTIADDSSTRLVLDLGIPEASMRVLQHISRPGDPRERPPLPKGVLPGPSNLDVTAVVDVTMSGFVTTGCFSDGVKSLNLSLGQLGVDLTTSIDKRTLDGGLSTLFFELTESSLAFGDQALALYLGQIRFQVGHLGPELALATSTSLLKTGSALVRFGKGIQDFHRRTSQRVFVNLLSASKQSAVIDPLSTIQPSYFVQFGQPKLLRTNLSFRFLYHLRTFVWNSAKTSLSQNMKNEGATNEELGLWDHVKDRLETLDQDDSSPSDLWFYDSLLEQEPAEIVKAKTKRPLPHTTVSLSQADIVVLAPNGGDSSSLTIKEVAFTFSSTKYQLTQFNFNALSGMSQGSMRAKAPRPLRRSAIIATVSNISLIVLPHLMDFAQHILRLKPKLQKPRSFLPPPNQDAVERLSIRDAKPTHFEILVSVRGLRVQAAAENLVLVIGLQALQLSSSLLTKGHESSSHAVLFEEAYLQALSPSDRSRSTEKDVLAALTFHTGRLSAILRAGADANVVATLTGVRLRVPRSALRLYRFVQEWRADYLPGMEAAISTLLSEYQAHATPSNESRSSLSINLNAQINHFEVALQVMHGTWLSLEVNKTIGYYTSPKALDARSNHRFGVQVATIILSVASKPNVRDLASNSRVKLVLPPLTLGGTSDGRFVDLSLLFEFIDLKVKPSHWDTLLAVQQKFGQDFNDLVALVRTTREKASHKPRKDKPAPSGKALQFKGAVKMKGFRLGLEGMSSVLYLECQDINGGFSNARGWNGELGLKDLALSLAPRIHGHQRYGSNLEHRSAFVTIDFKVDAKQEASLSDKHLDLAVTKIHAVMQPSSVGELGDFIDNMQAEMLERQEQRAMELAAFKDKTRKIFETFDVSAGDVPEPSSSWLNDFILRVFIKNIGVAFPLTHEEDVQPSRNKTPFAGRAFLFGVQSIEFGSHRGETGEATMRHLTFQFVPSFKQSVAAHFSADKHQTRNRLVYPEMKAHLRSSLANNTRTVWVSAQVNGFVLDIDSTIPNYVFSLIDVYRRGRERVERLSSAVPRTPLTPIPTFDNKPLIEKHYSSIPTSHIFGNLSFLSGKVRLFSASAGNAVQRKGLSLQQSLEISDEQILDTGAEIFALPVVSVWMEYRATSALRKLQKGPHPEPSILMFKSTVHSSYNTLRPTLLPFITELVGHVETRMRKISSRPSMPPSLTKPPISLPSPEKEARSETGAGMQISFSLKIDQSRLELTCLPDVNVLAGLHWDSGGFVVNVSPWAREVHFSGSVGGLTIGLKHGFLSEDCVRLDARNLSFSVSFAKSALENRASNNSISVALDTEFLGGVRFSRLQDVLCFKAVWLDRIPVFHPSPSDSKHALSRPLDEDADKPGITTNILVRIRQIQLDVDLGQSITSIHLGLQDTIFRTVLAEGFNEVFLYVGDVALSAKGNLSGSAHVPACMFQTVRRSDKGLGVAEEQRRMLELKLTSGPLVISLESDHNRLLHYRANPIEVEIFDDWSTSNQHSFNETQPLQLSFVVTSPEIVAAVTVGTIPKLLAYANKFKANLEAQRQGAARESQTFRVTRNPKPDNPLSAVAQAMIHSARSRFKEAEMELSYAIQQHMSLHLKLLRLVVFPRTMRDNEVAQFIARDVQARLNRIVGTELAPTRRDLELSFSSMVISKYTQLYHLGPMKALPDATDEWLSSLFNDAVEATIVGLPSMKMHMISEERTTETSSDLVYDFFSEFIRREGMKAFEDIYITLNMSLYSWLTLLRKNLTREMDQVRSAEDWRTAVSNVSSPVPGIQRKRVPEPLNLADPPRSATIPSAASYGLSPFAPSSARYPRPETARLALSPPHSAQVPSSAPFPSSAKDPDETAVSQPPPRRKGIDYKPRDRRIERLTMRQLGDATPDVMHPFFMKKAGFNLEDSLPQYVNEYATLPLEEIMAVLLRLYSRQLLSGQSKPARDND